MKIDSRTHMRRVTRRASTLSRGRCIHGLPCSLPVASWTLILLLLLSSSFSHVHETGERASEEAAVGAHENCLESNEGDDDLIPQRGVGGLTEVSSYAKPKDASKYDRLETSPISDLSSASEDEKGGAVVQALNLAHGFSPVSGSPLDALQYAEYGAGLLHKSGAAEESPKVFLVGNPGGIPCPIMIDPKQSVPSGNLPCTNDFSAKDHCQLFEVYNGESVGELNPGEYYLLCRRSPVSGLDVWEIACSTLTQCFKSGVDSKTCHYDRSLVNLFLHSSGMRRRPAQQLGITVTSADGELNLEASVESRSPALDQTEAMEAANPLASPASDDSKLPLIERSLQEGDIVTTHDGTDFEQSVDTMPPEDSATHEDHIRLLSDLNVHDDEENPKGQPSILPSTEVSIETYSDGSTLEGTRFSAYSQEDLGGIHVSVDDVLIEELQSMMKIDEEWLSSVKPPTSGGVEIENQLEPVRLRRVGSVMSLDEYKRSILDKQKLGNDVNWSSVQTHKMRHSDESYNYASSSQGAKVLGSNKEAKGAGHIINSDKDKYLRNPCSAEDKYVVLELSEETFVDTLVIANFEFHSANLKDLEVYGSPTYPTKEWILLGKYQAENVRHRQKFTIEDPKLVRYLMLKMLSHWGSEFFCTLSKVEVFGVDVIKNLLDDWIASEEGENGARAQTSGPAMHHEESPSESLHSSTASLDAALPDALGVQPPVEAASSQNLASTNKEKKVEAAARDEDLKVGDSAPEVHHVAGGKPPGDSVLKILMQKVKALELNQSLFDNYLEDMNVKYKAMLSELDKDLAVLSERLRNETAMSALLTMRLMEMESKRKEEKAYLEYQFAMVASNFSENMEFMRWRIQSMERREITAVILALFSMILSSLLHLLAHCMPNRRTSSTQEHSLQTEEGAEKTDPQTDSCTLHSVCKLSSSVVLYLSCGLTILVLSV